MIKSHALWMEKGMQQQGGGKAGRTSWPHRVDYHVQIQLPDGVAQASSIVRPACATEVCPYHSLRTTMLLILLLTSVLVPGSGPVLSYPVLSYPVLSCPVLAYPVLSFPVWSCRVLSWLVLSTRVLSCPVRSGPVLFGLVLSCTVPSCP